MRSATCPTPVWSAPSVSSPATIVSVIGLPVETPAAPAPTGGYIRLMDGHHLAQLNIGTLRAPVDHPAVAGFVNRLDEINALADMADGFVWRLQTEEGNATAIQAFDDPLLLVNLSVWESIDALHAFAYRTDHRELLRGRADWFHRHDGNYQVLWWVPAGHIPTVEEAKERLGRLDADGPTAHAFTFVHRFEPPRS